MTIGILVSAVIFAWPKLGSVMIWAVLFMYPHNWWYHNGFFPMNIGADDMFCVLLSVVVIVRRNLVDGLSIRLGYAFWVITAFTVISALANFVGASDAITGLGREEAIKGVLKPMVFWALFYAILHCIDNTRDLKIQITLFVVSATCGAVLVILQSYFPDQMNIFALPNTYGHRALLTPDSRGSGAFTNPNAAACVLGMSVLMSITALRMQKRVTIKIFIWLLMVVLLVGMLYTRSRSGLIALTICVVIMSFIGQSKSIALFCIISSISIAVVFVGMRELLTERISQTYNVETGTLGENIIGRQETWIIYLTESSMKDYLLGQGSSTAVAKFGMESHNAYISLLTVYGIGGFLWAIAATVGFVRRAVYSLKKNDPTVKAVAAGSLWALLFWGIYAFTADAISSYYSRFLLFYIVVLVDRAYTMVASPSVDVPVRTSCSR